MKKKGLIIASLLILVLSFVFLGCPPDDDKEEVDSSALNDAAKSVLTTLGYTEALPTPKGTTFKSGTATTISGYQAAQLIWTGADQDKFDAYSAIMTVARIVPSDSATPVVQTGFMGQLWFFDEDMTEGTVTYSANSIYLNLVKTTP